MIAGPTASGKSDAAQAIAERIGAAVVNMDALQVYGDLRILTARPTRDETQQAPHRLFGHVDATASYDVARWLAEAREALAGGAAVLVGGTGLYLAAALHGLAPVPTIDPAVRETVRSRSREENWAELGRLDPASTNRLRPSDTQRISRALEVVRSTGRTLIDWQAERAGCVLGPQTLGVVLDPPREALHGRIADRLQAMVDRGAVDEVRDLAARDDVPSSAQIWRALGARPIAAAVRGELSLDEARAQTESVTRAYAKRQRTWFRHQAPAQWPTVATPDDAVDTLAERMAGVAA